MTEPETEPETDAEFLQRLHDALTNIQAQFEQDKKRRIGPPYFVRLGNLEVIANVLLQLKKHLGLLDEDQSESSVSGEISGNGGRTDPGE